MTMPFNSGFFFPFQLSNVHSNIKKGMSQLPVGGCFTLCAASYLLAKSSKAEDGKYCSDMWKIMHNGEQERF